MRFHDLRHTCASLLLVQGVHPRVVMETLGRSQISLTMNTYRHVCLRCTAKPLTRCRSCWRRLPPRRPVYPVIPTVTQISGQHGYHSAVGTDKDIWLTIDQAVDYSKVSRSTLYQWCKEGRLSYRDQAGRGRVISRDNLDQILSPVVQASPAHAQGELIAAFDRLMRETYQLFADKPPKLDSIGKWVPYAIFGHLLRLGRALDLLVSNGYLEEARPTAQAMVAAALNIVTIVDAESDGRALQFIAYQRPLRRKALERLVAQGHLTSERKNAIDSADTDAEDKTLAGYAAAGIVPKPLGKNAATWHGLTDRDLAARMKASHWYDLYYGPLSDMGAHGNVASITSMVNEMLGGRFVIGPGGGDPTHLLMAAIEAVGQAAEQLERHYGLSKSTEVLEMRRHAWAAVLTHAHWSALRRNRG